MRYLSVCSGIEAATVAWRPLGWQAAWYSEIEKFPCAVLAHHYPSTPNRGDMTKFKEWPHAAIDLLVGGTPCQSFSVAGLRKGLADPRGNLMLTYLAIAYRYRPRWLVWENVPGVLSSNGGRDFGTFLGGLGELGYGFGYRVLDAQYFGVPQRRRRVFVVGYLGDWRRAAAVLFERHSLSGDTAPRREAREGVAGTITGGARSGGGYSEDDIPHIAFGGNNTSGSIDVATALNACPSASGRMDFETETFVAHPLRAQSQPSHRADSDTYIAHSLRGEGFDASEDGTGRGTPLVAVADTLRGHPRPGSNSLGAIAFDCKASGRNGFSVGNIAGTQRAMVNAESHTNGGGHQAVAYTTKLHNTTSNNAGKIFEERSTCLDSNSPPPALLTPLQVRRLTPRECERLQGFPDDYTLIPHRNKMAADGPRYKSLGNSMAVPVMRWIGERIAMVESLQVARKAA